MIPDKAFYLNPGNLNGNSFFLDQQESHHLTEVFRLKLKDLICLLDGLGTGYIGEIKTIEKMTFRVNDFMSGMFRGIGIKLVDFKLEFGKTKSDEAILLADEISPDTCRLWDQETDKKLDKDRFRKDLGNIVDAYQEVARRLGILHEQSNIRPIKFSKPTAVKIKKSK